MVVVSQWPQKLWYQGRSGTVYPYQSHSNVSWCLIKTDSGYVYGVWCWPGASLRGQKLITHTRVLGPVVTIRLCVSRNIRQQQMWRAKYTRHQLNHEKTRHVRMGPDGDKLWGWHFMTTETLGDPSHVTCHKLQIIGSSHQAPVTPVTRAWLPGKQPHSNVQNETWIIECLCQYLWYFVKVPWIWGLWTGNLTGLDNYFKAQNYRIMITDEKHKAVLWEPGWWLCCGQPNYF